MDWGFGEKRWEKGDSEELRPAKTFWDLLQLAVVPVALVVIALIFNQWQATRDRAREATRVREDRALARDSRHEQALQEYLGRISELTLDRRLLSTERRDVPVIARSLTHVALRGLDNVRKGDVLQFLARAGLIDRRDPGPRISLYGADLRGVELSESSLSHMDLSGADLREARFDRATLLDVDLLGADLRGATFRESRLFDLEFEGARLEHARFDGAELKAAATPRGPWFRRSCLTGASFEGASLSGVTFEDAQGGGIQLDRARLSNGASTGSLSASTDTCRSAPRG